MYILDYMEAKVLRYFARPIASMDVQLAKNNLMKVYDLEEQLARDIIHRLNVPCYIAVFPNTYCVKIEDGALSSTLVSTYGDETTLRLLSNMRKLNPESFK